MDLTGLDEIVLLNTGEIVTGEPLLIALDDIVRDPNQPRTIFDQVKLRELGENIRDRGVKSPISVKPKNAAGKYIINHGERRWLGARIAGLTHIAAFVDTEHDEFDQVVENILRDDLKPLELADWLQTRIEKGYKQVEIARKLKKGKDWVSRHIKIATAPQEIRVIADRCSDYTALSDLTTAFENYPNETLEFIANVEQIARKDITLLVTRCKNLSSQEVIRTVGTKLQDPIININSQLNEKIREQGTVAASVKQNVASTEKNRKSSEKVPALNAIDSVKILNNIYTAQVFDKQDTKTVIEKLNHEEWLNVCHELMKENRNGLNTSQSIFITTLVQGMQDGIYGHTGFGLYSMLAFVQGSIYKNELNEENIRECCFKVVDKLL